MTNDASGGMAGRPRKRSVVPFLVGGIVIVAGMAAGVLWLCRPTDGLRLAKRASSAANLYGIGKGMSLYRLEHEDKCPADLLVLVEWGTIQAEHLFSPTSGRKPKFDKDGKPVGPFDYVYLAPRKALPGDVMVAYERPEINDNEGTNILTYGCTVQWVTMDEFRRELARTRELLAEKRK